MAYTYPKVDRPAHVRAAAKLLDEIATLAGSLELDLPAIADGREMVERASRFRDQLATMRSEKRDAAAKRLARQIVSGDLDLEQAIDESRRIEALEAGSVFASAVKLTEGTAVTLAFQHVGRTLGGGEVFDALRQIAADTLDAVRKLRRPLAGVRSADQAAAAGSKQAAAWAEYIALRARFDTVHQLVAALRRQHWIDPLPEGTHAVRYGRHDIAREDSRLARRSDHQLLPLLDERTDAWEPGLYNEHEALEWERVIDQAAGAADAARPEDPVAAALRADRDDRQREQEIAAGR